MSAPQRGTPGERRSQVRRRLALLGMALLMAPTPVTSQEAAQEVRANRLRLFYKTYLDQPIVVTHAYLSAEMRPESIFGEYFVLYVYDDSRNQVGFSWFSDVGLNTVVKAGLAAQWQDYCATHGVAEYVLVRANLYGRLSTITKTLRFTVFEITRIETLNWSGEVTNVLIVE